METALGWLLRPPLAVPDVFHRSVLGPVTWQALVRDGILHHVWGDVAIPANRTETPGDRALAVEPLVPVRGVVGRAAAVWLHTGGPPPGRIDVLVPTRSRRPDPHPMRVPHESTLPADDVVVVGPIRVTTVARTAIDVARWSGAAQASELLVRLVEVGGLDPGGALSLLDGLLGQPRISHARVALTTLAAGRRVRSPRRSRSRNAPRPPGSR